VHPADLLALIGKGNELNRMDYPHDDEAKQLLEELQARRGGG
jgi:hypothetical protein